MQYLFVIVFSIFLGITRPISWAAKMPFFQTGLVPPPLVNELGHHHYFMSVSLDNSRWTIVHHQRNERVDKILFHAKDNNAVALTLSLYPYYDQDGTRTKASFEQLTKNLPLSHGYICSQSPNSQFKYKVIEGSESVFDIKWDCRNNTAVGRDRVIKHELGVYLVTFAVESKYYDEYKEELTAILDSINIYGF